MLEFDRRIRVGVVAVTILWLAILTVPVGAIPLPERWRARGLSEEAWEQLVFGDEEALVGDVKSAFLHLQECIDGMAGGYPCLNVDLYELVTLAAMGGSRGNDIWGWTDPVTGKEYALMGMDNGTSFVDISDPEEPVIIGSLATHTSNSSWRDIKVYADHAFIGSEASGHGMQIFDLTQLRDVVSPPVAFSNTAHYDEFGSSHNIVINEESGFAYSVGSNTCSAGPHMIDISDPVNPVNAGCVSGDGYTHDAQCVNYIGPDPDHAGKEICINSNEDTLTLVDVTNKAAPVQLSRTGYAGAGYTHQGWLTEDHSYFLLDDEGDEGGFGVNTKTYIWDMRDLDAPTLIGEYFASTTNTDHNQYIVGNHVYQANYGAGLRILNLDDIAAGNLTEVAFFDSSSAWSVYPFFESGTVIVSDINLGLFILRPQLCSTPAAPTALAATGNGDQSIELTWSGGNPGETFNVYRSFGTCPGGTFEQIASGVIANNYVDSVSGQVDYSYYVTAVDTSGMCESAATACSSASTTGACIAPPVFAGLETVTDPAAVNCQLDLSWSAAAPNCGVAVDYSVYKSTDPGFTPSPANLAVAGLTGTTWSDTDVLDGVTYAYVTRATDLGSGTEDDNLVVVTGTPTGPLADGTFLTGAEPGDPFLPSYNGTSNSSAKSAAGFSLKNHVGWEFSTAEQHTGDRSFFSTYSDGMCSSLSTLELPLTPGDGSQLSFWTAFDIESQNDGGVVQVSIDSGTTWQQLDLLEGYPGAFNNSDDGCGFAEGTPAFTGTDLNWTEYTADLSSFSGEEVLIRWTFSANGDITQEGWYLDDVSVSHAQVASVCSSGSIFFDGFENGGTSAWSSTTP